MRLAVLSVHYRYPELIADQITRLRSCADPLESTLEAELGFFPIVHARSGADVVRQARVACDASHGFATLVDLRHGPGLPVPARGLLWHGHSLLAAYRGLRQEGSLGDDDLLAVMDHDAHPLDAGCFAVLASRLTANPGLAGIGIPQWYHGRCYLHPSFLLTRVATVEEMGAEQALLSRQPAHPADRDWYDTCEGFTIWCERHGRPILPLRVVSTAFPFHRWDSDMAPGGGTELTAWHGEHVQVGHLMRFGLDADRPLISHVWAGFLGPYQEDGFSRFTWEEVAAVYLAEPMICQTEEAT